MRADANVKFIATVQHRLIRADGSIQETEPDTKVISRPHHYWRRLWEQLRKCVPFVATMSFGTFLEWAMYRPQHGMDILAHAPVSLGIVTQAGITYLSTAFTSAANPINNFNYHTYGTGDVHGSTSSPTNATAATPIVVTQAGHPFFNNDIIKLTGITGITGINGIWEITYISSSSYSLDGSVGGGSGFGGGTNAAQLLNGQADTALTTEASGLSRVAGTQTNPSSFVYRSVATVPFTGATPPLSIVEWGLFSASSSGTLWDRRWMNTGNAPSTIATAALTAAPITITQTSDSIATTYNLTSTAGGT